MIGQPTLEADTVKQVAGAPTKNKHQGIERVSPLVKCILLRHEGLSLIPSIHIKVLATVAHTCNPSAGETETEGSLELAGQPVELKLQAPGSLRTPASTNHVEATE